MSEHGYNWLFVAPWEDHVAQSAPIMDELPADPEDGQTVRLRVRVEAGPPAPESVVWTLRYVA